jgi:hypothetical protein
MRRLVGVGGSVVPDLNIPLFRVTFARNLGSTSVNGKHDFSITRSQKGQNDKKKSVIKKREEQK